MRRRSFSVFVTLLLGIILTLCLALAASAQEKKGGAKEDRLSGRVHMINKETSTITIRVGSIQRQVVYNADTKFTVRNKAGSMTEVKDGRRVICMGKYDDKARLVASRVDVRDTN